MVDLATFEAAVSAVPWRALRGAYGVSDGSEISREHLSDGRILERPVGDVPKALRALASTTDPDSDDWLDALDVIQSHVWHQGDIYPVATGVIPLLFTLVQGKEGLCRRELAGLIIAIVETAKGYGDAAEAKKRTLGQEVLALVEAHAGALLEWWGRELPGEGAFIALASSQLREPYLERLSQRDTLDVRSWTAIARLAEAPDWAKSRAANTLLTTPDPATRIAAALVAAKGEALAVELAQAADAALGPQAPGLLTDALALPVALPAFPKEPLARFGGPLVLAEVLYVTESLITVRVAPHRNVRVRWPGSGLRVGEELRVGVSPDGFVRAAELTRADGTVERRDFGLRGEPLARPREA